MARLRILKAAHEGKRFALQDAVTFQYPKRIQSLKGELQLLQKDLERRNQAMEVQQGFAITLQGKVYEKHKEAGEVLRGIIEGVTAFTRHEVGMYKGFHADIPAASAVLSAGFFLEILHHAAFFLFFSPLPDIIGTSVLPCGRKEGGKN